jgi:hypothetical protein
MRTDPPEKKFLAFLYPEIKDLAKHFLTLVSGVLVFSVTFSEKIVPFSIATTFEKRALLTAWLLWIAAVILAGLAILFNFLAATQMLRQHERDNRPLVRLTYAAIDAGGVCFVAGLVALALSAVSRLM